MRFSGLRELCRRDSGRAAVTGTPLAAALTARACFRRVHQLLHGAHLVAANGLCRRLRDFSQRIEILREAFRRNIPNLATLTFVQAFFDESRQGLDVPLVATDGL